MKNGFREMSAKILLVSIFICQSLLPVYVSAATTTSYAQPYIASFTPQSGPIGTVITGRIQLRSATDIRI